MQGMGKRGIVAAIAVGLLAAGCGGGSSAVTAPNTPKQLAADKATAKAAVLTASDLPAGYKGTPHKKSSGDDIPTAVETKFLACTHLPKRFINDSGDKQPNADAPDFAKGTLGQGASTEIESSVELDRSSNDIKDPLSHLSGSNAAACFKPFFQAALNTSLSGTSGVTIAPVKMTVLDLGSVGDQSGAFQGRTTVSGPSASITFEFNLYFVRTGRAGVFMLTIATNAPFDQTLAKSLLSTMVGRLGAAK